MPREIAPRNERLYAARYEAGWSQQELGDAAGVSRQMVNSYERFQSRPKAATAERIARSLSLKTGRVYRVSDLFSVAVDANDSEAA